MVILTLMSVHLPLVALLADLIAAYILEVTSHCFRCTTIFVRIYCDDGFIVFHGKHLLSEIHKWWQRLQAEINKVAEGSYFQVTIVIWELGGMDWKVGAVSVSTCQSFPYLDMELFWSRSGDLNFCIHLKDNQ
jgi:hypothetical protein